MLCAPTVPLSLVCGSVFLRGSHVRFMVLPDILKNAPFFKKIETKSVKQAARGGKAKQAATQRTAGAPRHQLSRAGGRRR